MERRSRVAGSDLRRGGEGAGMSGSLCFVSGVFRRVSQAGAAGSQGRNIVRRVGRNCAFLAGEVASTCCKSLAKVSDPDLICVRGAIRYSIYECGRG